jgi:hypothetical protein
MAIVIKLLPRMGLAEALGVVAIWKRANAAVERRNAPALRISFVDTTFT